MITPHSLPRASLSTRVKKEISFVDDRLNVIPAGEAEICVHAVGFMSTNKSDLIHRLVMDETGECKISPEAKVMIYLIISTQQDLKDLQMRRIFTEVFVS